MSVSFIAELSPVYCCLVVIIIGILYEIIVIIIGILYEIIVICFRFFLFVLLLVQLCLCQKVNQG